MSVFRRDFEVINCLSLSLLVGDGAKQWAEQNGLPLIDNQQMKTGSIRRISHVNPSIVIDFREQYLHA